MTASPLLYPRSGDGRPAPPPERVHDRLLAWFAVQGRDLPWRRTRDPYAILVAEMMLQQTGVERVLPKYEAWLVRFPTLRSLAHAPRGDVIRLWAGLGYNSRAVRLQEIARQAVERYDGRLPDTLEGLRSLKGIGPYTAGAVLCFAHERDVAFVDTNIRRVLGRVFLGAEQGHRDITERDIYSLAERVVPAGRAWAWYQGLMDLGATMCVDGKPACLVCPLQEVCRGAFQAGRLVRERSAAYRPRRKEDAWTGSTRYYRGRIIAALRELSAGERLSIAELTRRAAGGDGGQEALVRDLAARLAADGLVDLREAPDGETTAALPD